MTKGKKIFLLQRKFCSRSTRNFSILQTFISSCWIIIVIGISIERELVKFRLKTFPISLFPPLENVALGKKKLYPSLSIPSPYIPIKKKRLFSTRLKSKFERYKRKVWIFASPRFAWLAIRNRIATDRSRPFFPLLLSSPPLAFFHRLSSSSSSSSTSARNPSNKNGSKSEGRYRKLGNRHPLRLFSPRNLIPLSFHDPLIFHVSRATGSPSTLSIESKGV